MSVSTGLGANVGTAWVALRFSARGAAKQISGELAAEGEAAGSTMGTSASKKFGSSFSKGISGLKKAVLPVSAAVAAIGYESIKAASSFQASMLKVRTQAGASQAEVNKMSKAVLDLAKSSQQGPQELADSLYHLESLGLRGAKAMDALKISMKLAAVSGADLEQASSAIGGAWRTGIVGAKSFSQSAATLNAIVGAGNMRMSDLLGALGTGILPAAKTFGLNLKQVGSALALFTDEGVPAVDAATRLRMTFSLLGAPSQLAIKQLGTIGLSGTALANAMRSPGGLIAAIQLLKNHLDDSGKSATEQAALLSRAFGGGRSSSAILSMLNNLSVLKMKQDQVNNSVGKFGSAVQAQSKTASAQFAILRSGVETLGIQIGEKLLPVATSFTKWLTTNHEGAIDLGIALGGVSAALLAIRSAVAGVTAIVNIGKAFKTAAIAIKTFGAATIIASAAQKDMTISNAAFAVGADGTVTALTKMTTAGKAWALVSGAIGAINPFVWVAGAAIGVTALGVIIARQAKSVYAYSDSLQAADKAQGFNISGYQKLAGQLDTQGKLHDQVAKSIKAESSSYGGLYGNLANVRAQYTVLGAAQTQAATTASRLVTQLGNLQTEFGITRTQAEQLSVKAGVSAKQLAASGTSGAQAALKIQKYATGAGAAAVKEDQLADATSKFNDALGRLNNSVLAGQGDTISWRESQQAATNAVKEATKGLNNNSGAALNAKQALLASTQAAADLAKHMVDVQGNTKGATRVLQEQIKYLEQHAAKSKFAAQEIDILRKAEDALKNKHLQITVDGKGQYSVQAYAQAGGAASQHGVGGGGSRRLLGGMTRGGKLPGYGGGDRRLTLLEDGEAVVDKSRARKFAPTLAAMGVPGYKDGGVIGGYSGPVAGLAPWMTSNYDTTANMVAAATAKSTSSALQSLFSSMGGAGGGVTQWSGLVLKALGLLGQPASWLGVVLRRMNQESGGNPDAINRWDSNAAAGHPSQGLMQTIPSTFSEYAGPFRALGILNPLANIYAGLNYALHRYGSLSALSQPGGYDKGGIANGLGMMSKRTIKPERVLSPQQTSAFERLVNVLDGRSGGSAGPSRQKVEFDPRTMEMWIRDLSSQEAGSEIAFRRK